MRTFFTIDGVEDREFLPDHPDVIRFYDKGSADKMLNFLQGLGAFTGCYVQEHQDVNNIRTRETPRQYQGQSG